MKKRRTNHPRLLQLSSRCSESKEEFLFAAHILRWVVFGFRCFVVPADSPGSHVRTGLLGVSNFSGFEFDSGLSQLALVHFLFASYMIGCSVGGFPISCHNFRVRVSEIYV